MKKFAVSYTVGGLHGTKQIEGVHIETAKSDIERFCQGLLAELNKHADPERRVRGYSYKISPC